MQNMYYIGLDVHKRTIMEGSQITGNLGAPTNLTRAGQPRNSPMANSPDAGLLRGFRAGGAMLQRAAV